ncbi:ribbon-helix-helix domain-containing protein, partial [Rhizobium ruizarguesonis]
KADARLWESTTRSLRIDGMVTIVRLENFFWAKLEEIARRVEAGDGTGDIGRDVAGELQVERASAADPQEGREVAEIMAG